MAWISSWKSTVLGLDWAPSIWKVCLKQRMIDSQILSCWFLVPILCHHHLLQQLCLATILLRVKLSAANCNNSMQPFSTFFQLDFRHYFLHLMLPTSCSSGLTWLPSTCRSQFRRDDIIGATCRWKEASVSLHFSSPSKLLFCYAWDSQKRQA